MKRSFISVAIALALFATVAAIADPVEITYDSGNRGGHFDQAAAGDIEGVYFTPAHPCSLLSISFWPIGTGDMEWHVWADNGGNMPDVERDLIEPVMVNVRSDRDWINLDLSGAGLVFDPPTHFHVGYVKQADDPDLWVDGGNNFEQRSFLRLGNTWYVTGDGSGNYLLRCNVEYFNEQHDFTFNWVSRQTGIRDFSNCAWADYDNDGWEDLLCDGRTLYRNLGNGTFEDVSDEAGIVADNPANSGAWGDFDNDGWIDFYATTSDLNADDRLYHNNGDGTFTFANDDYWLYNGSDETQAAGWGDADGDGFLEIYIANSETWGDGSNPIYYPDHMFRYNPNDQVFEEITPSDVARLRYYGRGVAWCDFNMDGLMDLYISNYRLHPNFLLVNQGNFVFRNQARSRGVEGISGQNAWGHTIGSSWADYDNDGDFDLFVGNLAHPRFLAFSDKCMLYRNNGAPDWDFTDVRDSSGIKYDETASSPAWGDYDNDGWLDLFITSVYEGRQPYLYRNRGDGTFENANYPAGLHEQCYNSWGVSWCDWDHDGDLDLAVGGNHGGMYRNDSPARHWVQFQLAGVESNKFAYGAKAWVHTGELHQLRQVEGSMGTGSCQNMLALQFGLADYDRVDSLIIKWLSGHTDRYYDIPVDRRYIATEGEGIDLAVPNSGFIPHPSAFSLSAYPNPFNSRTTVSYEIPSDANVRLTVHTLDGRLVEELINSRFPAGQHTAVWDGGELAAGVYLLRLESAGEARVTKGVIIK